MKQNVIPFIASLFLAVSTAATAGAASGSVDNDTKQVRAVVAKYASSIDGADTKAAEKIWVTNADASFIHPRGHEISWEAVKKNFYGKTMGENFSERHLVPYNIAAQVFGNTAYVEFYWKFDAKFRADGKTLHTEGRESQMLIRDRKGWRIVKVHYSAMPVTGAGQGF